MRSAWFTKPSGGDRLAGLSGGHFRYSETQPHRCMSAFWTTNVAERASPPRRCDQPGEKDGTSVLEPSKVATAKRRPAIPLPGPLLAHLKRWRRQGQTFAVEFDGRRVDNISKALRSLVKECGLGSDVVPHTLRHTGVTWGMQSGMDTWLASGYFGMTVEVLLNVYGHHHPEHLREAAAKMARPRR